MQIHDTNYTPNNTQKATALTPDSKPQASTGLSFGDVLDTVNPLQHIPVVSSIYRSMTGDSMSQAARLAGDSLYGGVVGAASAVVNIIAEEVTGKDIGENIIASGTDNNNNIYQSSSPAILVANNDQTIKATLPSTTSTQTTIDDKQYFKITKDTKETEIANLGLDNENVRQQLLGQLSETLYKKL